MDIKRMTRKGFDSLPLRKWGTDIGEFSSIIILPQRKLHESGYRLLDFVAVKGNEPICRLSGCSDIIHIDGISGYGYKWIEKYNKCPSLVPPTGWSIDCLPKSGLLRMWPRSVRIRCGLALGSFEVFSITEKFIESECELERAEYETEIRDKKED